MIPSSRNTREKSILLDELNLASLDRAALQQTALDSVSDDPDEFTQAAAWTASEIEGEISAGRAARRLIPGVATSPSDRVRPQTPRSLRSNREPIGVNLV